MSPVLRSTDMIQLCMYSLHHFYFIKLIMHVHRFLDNYQRLELGVEKKRRAKGYT